EEGLDESFVVNDGGVIRTQIWHYPARSECVDCHTANGGLALGFNTAQMNRDFDHGAGPENQIRALSDAGYFQADAGSVNHLRALATATNIAYSAEYRARSYLAANCVQCHQPGGPGQWDARIVTPTASAGLINGKLNNDLGDATNKVIVPGAPDKSMLLRRIAIKDSHHMPPLATTELNHEAIDLVTSWIVGDSTNLVAFADWQTRYFGSPDAADAGELADPDADGLSNQTEYLLGTNPLAKNDPPRTEISSSENDVTIGFLQNPNLVYEVQFANTLGPEMLWQTLDAPGNRPFPSSTMITNLLHDVITGDAARYYRLRVTRP
ncbi:MAG TPA: hypothetical protein VHH73_18240, partial [Verrucomicrobiae bacterium]|nr:hypothetical protein [Verrucomicrobiae bacterium]